ncbi:MAG: outer membrane lipoprotein carrier protein LolA [Bacteroidia bacterium]|nr:outer membrane lipoprotein carrier protein LolA [Bacteroidia bacterium]MBT8269007.1 outer membrane lipoprotein carrier protein LolA [Bacteroidia bacterium]NNF81764.1 outer membrane lipoprotein carrier protein LolA [Flavobacteriaceae bacterium]NNK70747.1 outer membrane lipoprotein carrier protein LolA [Flavobacteriaceae bacterium]NNL80902.1 outer membrane lipoprotein carrier protein LolA [Flavobacteriaceae bacterium]
MRTTLMFLMCLSLGFSTLAQSNSNEAKTLLDEVSAKVKSYDNITIDFKYVLDNSEENIKQETRGDVIMEGDKYILNILGITRIYDGRTLYTISPEDEEVTISSENTEEENTITPSMMLSFYESGYTYNMDIVQNVQGRKIQFVKLIPIDSNTEIKHVLLGIDVKTKHIYNLIEIGSNNTRTTLTVNSFKTNEPLSKTLFTFDESKYSDYFINRID